MSKIKVLGVDDSPFIHKAITKALDPEFFEICEFARNGRQGVNGYTANQPDVVLMDITMPIMDGLEASKQIMALDPKAKIILLSAMWDDELIETAKVIGISANMNKPFKSEELTMAINNLCKG